MCVVLLLLLLLQDCAAGRFSGGRGNALFHSLFSPLTAPPFPDLSTQPNNPTQTTGARSVEDLDKVRYAKGNTSTAAIRKHMQKTMQDHAAVYRTQDSLAEGKVKIDEVCR